MADYENNIQWQDVFLRNFNMLVNMFEWEGMPETVNTEFLESVLLWDAQACVIFDENFKSYLGLPTVQSSNQNIYYQTNFYRAYSLNYTHKFLALNKYTQPIVDGIVSLAGGTIEAGLWRGVVCFDNFMVYPVVNTLEIYTSKIVNAMRAIDVVQTQAKLPTIIETDEDNKLAIQQAISDIDTNVLAIYAGKNLAKAIKETKSFPTQFSPDLLDILWAHKNNIESEMLTVFGINNLNTNDKKERLLTDEINSNNQIINNNLATRLDQRKLFCDNLNRAFGLNVSVKVKHNEAGNIGNPERGDFSGADNQNTGGNSGDT